MAALTMEPSGYTPGDDGMEEDSMGNLPFSIPANEDIFRLREEEKHSTARDKLRMATQRVHEKSTFTSRMQAMHVDHNKMGTMRETVSKKAAGGEGGGEPTLAEVTAPPAARSQKENMADFIAKKREIFLVQMSLDTKRAEIKKLEERARQREEALKKSERMLEEDALRFDAFLKENDEKVQEAIKHAEHEAKLRHDRVQEIKRLNGLMAILKSELSKCAERVEDCHRYKAFLDSITPVEFFDDKQRKLQKRRDAIMAQWQADCEAVRKLKADAIAAKAQAEHDYEYARTQQAADRAQRAIKDSTKALKAALLEQEPPQPDLNLLVRDDEGGMFFNSPEQLLKIYHELEETNLFLIQNAQESEEVLEEVKSKYQETKAQMDGTVANLQGQIVQLESQISAAKERTTRLLQQTIENVGGLTLSDDVPDISFEALTGKVAEMFVRCGFDADASLTSVQMLANMELRLEEYLEFLSRAPLEYVIEAEKGRNKERRHAMREQKMEDQKREHEARSQRNRERAAAPVFKKVGKPVMFRSQPAKKKVVVEDDPNAVEEEELSKFLAKEML